MFIESFGTLHLLFCINGPFLFRLEIFKKVHVRGENLFDLICESDGHRGRQNAVQLKYDYWAHSLIEVLL